MLGKRVTGDVGFLEQRESGDPPAGKLVPLRVAYRVKMHLSDQVFKQPAERAFVRQRGRIARVSFDDPFTAGHINQ
jgi:hypothetical protein